jgi:putative oxidoreductase
MKNKHQDLTMLIARLLLALLFIVSGLSKSSGFLGTAAYIQSKGLPMADLLTVLTIAVELLAGFALALGVATRWAAWGLAIFTLAASQVFHNFWAMDGQAGNLNQIMYLKNLSIVGGLLMVALFGPGKYSLDARNQRRLFTTSALNT